MCLVRGHGDGAVHVAMVIPKVGNTTTFAFPGLQPEVCVVREGVAEERGGGHVPHGAEDNAEVVSAGPERGASRSHHVGLGPPQKRVEDRRAEHAAERAALQDP